MLPTVLLAGGMEGVPDSGALTTQSRETVVLMKADPWPRPCYLR